MIAYILIAIGAATLVSVVLRLINRRPSDKKSEPSVTQYRIAYYPEVDMYVAMYGIQYMKLYEPLLVVSFDKNFVFATKCKTEEEAMRIIRIHKQQETGEGVLVKTVVV